MLAAVRSPGFTFRSASRRVYPIQVSRAHWAKPRLAVLLLLLGACPAFGRTMPGQASPAKAAPAQTEQKLLDATRIAAVVNGDVITNNDIDNRGRLFAMSTGMAMAPDVLDRLKPQILRQLVDERLRIQEAQRRKVVIQDKQIADAIHDIEQRNNMPAGALRQKLAADGVSQRTLIDQIRAQLAWGQVLRDLVAEKVNITDADVLEQQKLETQMIGQPEYRLGEIFIPVDDPANTADAQRFAETVINELHAGAAFPLVAAQFSQTQTALEGGEIGWVQTNQLDPQIARLVTQMPIGAVSNPVKVPGGFTIVALQGRREVGRDIATVVTMRQAFVSFTSALDPQAPTDQQRQALAKARNISSTVHSCEQMEQVAKATNQSNRPINPGEVRVEGVNPPAFRQLLATIPIGKATEPLISRDGIAVISVCTREEKNTAEITTEEVRRRLINEHVELLSRQTMRDLHRQANIDLRGGGV
ncbi:peptidylprolyl isomerase [Rhodopila sp.]|uniref:peptidylprolyl isomerase n=1 Tax=Rhodopila sp. TaxID=2480087 RepID=UPI003D0F8869